MFRKKHAVTDEEVIAKAVEQEDEKIDVPFSEEEWAVDYFRGLDKKTYEKLLKKIEIYRDADEAVAKLDQKRVIKKTQELLENEYTEA